MIKTPELLTATDIWVFLDIMPIMFSYNMGFGAGSNDGEKTIMILLPALSGENGQTLAASMDLSPESIACYRELAQNLRVPYAPLYLSNDQNSGIATIEPIIERYCALSGNIISALCKWKGVEIIEGHLMPDHMHMLVSIPLKMSA